MKLTACTILYHPTINEIENINSYIKLVDVLYIFDNSELKDNSSLLAHLVSDNYEYINFNENKGLCVPLNIALKKSYDIGSDFMLTMDQDSSFKEENFLRYKDDISNFIDQDKVGQFGLNHNIEDQKLNQKYFEFAPYLITSGSVINLKVTKQNNISFDENYFIDCLDFDFAFQLNLNGFLNVKFLKNAFNHQIGDPIYRGSFKSLYIIKKKKNIHSAIRLYYIQRNVLYFEKKYKNTTLRKISTNIKKELVAHIKVSIYYAKNPFQAFKFILKGKRDFRNNKFGKIEI